MSTSSNPNTIFNVPEPVGAERVQFETTAAEAQINAPSSRIAREIESNADQAQDAAQQAASVAKTLGPEFTGEPATAVDQFGRGASETTNAAVNEGKHDVEAAKATGAGYIDQAKSIASNAISTAQAYLPTAVGGKPADHTATSNTQGGSILSSTTATLSSATQVVQEAVQPHIETAKGLAQNTFSTSADRSTTSNNQGGSILSSTTATLSSATHAVQEAVQPHVEAAKGLAQNTFGTAGTQGLSTQNAPASSAGIPATSAPLESGPHTTKTPYPATATTTGTNIAQNESAPTVN